MPGGVFGLGAGLAPIRRTCRRGITSRRDENGRRELRQLMPCRRVGWARRMKSWLSMHSTQNRPIPPARRERVDIDRQNLLVTIPAERLQFGALLARLDRIARPHVIHATAGKDRTGW